MKKSLSKPQSIATKSAFKPLIKVTSTIQVTIKNVTCFYFLHNTVEVAGLEGDRAKFRALAKKRR